MCLHSSILYIIDDQYTKKEAFNQEKFQKDVNMTYLATRSTFRRSR